MDFKRLSISFKIHFLFYVDIVLLILILNFYKITTQKRKIRYNPFQKRYVQKYNFKAFEHGIYFVEYQYKIL